MSETKNNSYIDLSSRAEYGKRLRASLKVSPYSQKGLAEKIGVSPQLINNWLVGKSSPKFSTALDLCEALNIDIEWLTNGVDKEPSSSIGYLEHSANQDAERQEYRDNLQGDELAEVESDEKAGRDIQLMMFKKRFKACELVNMELLQEAIGIIYEITKESNNKLTPVEFSESCCVVYQALNDKSSVSDAMRVVMRLAINSQ